MSHILAVMPYEQRHKEYLESKAPGYSFEYSSIAEVTEEQVKKADIILGNAPEEFVKKNDHLKWIQLNSAGADRYCKPGILKEETILTCATGAYGLSVSEWLVTVSFMLCRKMDLYARNQAAHIWRSEQQVSSIWNSTTLVLGLGDIGSEYAKRMKALGSRVIGVRRHASSVIPEYLDELYTIEKLDELLPEADFVALVLPGTPETNHIIDARRLALMKPGAFLINAGRGNSVDLEALNKALREGTIGGAAIDVVYREPLEEDSPLWDAPRCIICPHIAGKFHLPETFERIVRICGDNLEKYVSGDVDHMRNIVDRKTGYRRR